MWNKISLLSMIASVVLAVILLLIVLSIILIENNFTLPLWVIVLTAVDVILFLLGVTIRYLLILKDSFKSRNLF
jgi:hypothetical protein